VIYGALPPEMRRLQARLFNEPNNDFTVLVASDAVGMGLNLNIRRIIFHTLQKYDGSANARAPVSVSMIKQVLSTNEWQLICTLPEACRMNIRSHWHFRCCTSCTERAPQTG